MQRIISAVIVAALLAPILLFGQGNYGRRTRGSTSAGKVGADGLPTVTFRGNLKELTKKELRIDVDSGEQSITFRVSGKTHFIKDGKPIKPANVALDTVVAVDAARDPDLQFSALNVIVNPPKPKEASQ